MGGRAVAFVEVVALAAVVVVVVVVVKTTILKTAIYRHVES